MEIWSHTRRVMADVLALSEYSGTDIAALGITNQRETTVVWDRTTGEPVYNAIVWQDTRTSDICSELDPHLFERTGLPVSTYFSGPKIAWILDNVPGARARADAGELAFGTIDSWLVWRLTKGNVHCTDVTNASRTMLMDLNTLQWDAELCAALGIPSVHAPPYCLLLRRDRNRRAIRRIQRGTHHRNPGRPTGSHLRASLPGTRGGEKHLRNREFSPAQHGHGAASQHTRTYFHRLLQTGRSTHCVRLGGVHRCDRVAHHSGCATTSALSAVRQRWKP